MAIADSDLKFYVSINKEIDGDGTNNGGDIDRLSINTDIKNVTSSLAESGGSRYYKFFVKNENNTDTALALNLILQKAPQGMEYVEIIKASSNTSKLVDENFTNSQICGIAETITIFNRSTKTVKLKTKSNPIEIFKSGYEITFFDKTTLSKVVTLTVSSVANISNVDSFNEFDLIVVEDLPEYVDLTNTNVSGTLEIGDLAPETYSGFWFKHTIMPFARYVSNDTFNIGGFFDKV